MDTDITSCRTAGSHTNTNVAMYIQWLVKGDVLLLCG